MNPCIHRPVLIKLLLRKVPLQRSRIVSLQSFYFTCLSYAEARNRYRLDVRPSVRLSVCLSVTRWHCIKTAEYIVMLSSPTIAHSF